jgi:RND family efflux transporter MFP subunit
VVEAKMMIKLGSPDTGIVEVVKVDRDSTVKKGDVVAQLDSDLQRTALELAQLKASNEADIKSERTKLAYRIGEAERATTLYSRQIASTKARDEAVTERDVAEHALAKAELEHRMAQADMAQAQIRLDRRSIRSPVNGVVADVTIRPGEYVYEQTPLMTIAEIDPLYVKVWVPVHHYRQIHVGTNAEVMPEEPIGGLYWAQVTVVDRVFDTASSTFGVRLELANPDYSLPAGMRCRIRFLTQQAAP